MRRVGCAHAREAQRGVPQRPQVIMVHDMDPPACVLVHVLHPNKRRSRDGMVRIERDGKQHAAPYPENENTTGTPFLVWTTPGDVLRHCVQLGCPDLDHLRLWADSHCLHIIWAKWTKMIREDFRHPQTPGPHLLPFYGFTVSICFRLFFLLGICT